MEQSYTDWKNNTEHLTKSQFHLAQDLMLKGKGLVGSISLAEEVILPGEDRKKYLRSQSRIYIIGWLNRERDELIEKEKPKAKDKINVSFKDELEYEQGYEDCKRNSEKLKNMEAVA